MEFKDLVFLVFEPFYYWLFYKFVSKHNLKRINSLATIVMIVIGITISIIVNFTTDNEYINLAVSLITCALIVYIISGRLGISILLAVFWIAIAFVAEGIGAYILMLITKCEIEEITSNNLYYTLGIFISRVLLLLFSLINSKKEYSNNNPYWLALFSLLFSGSIALSTLTYQIIGDNINAAPKLLVISGIILFMNLLIIYLMESIYKKERTEKDLIIANKYIEIHEKSYKIEKMNSEREKIERHDFKNKLTLMQTYIERKEIDKLESLINEVKQSYETVDVYKTGNEAIDIILNSKKSIAISKDIKLKAKVRIEEEITISNVDLAALLGNAIDNSIEAAEKIRESSNRWIDIDIIANNGIMLICVNNPLYEELLLDKAGKIQSTKTTSGHGYGIMSMQEIAKKYQGEVEFYVENNQFCLKILLYCEG